MTDFSVWLKSHPQFKDDMHLAEDLLTEAKIATITGTPFGGPQCIRLSFASSMDTLEKAVRQLRQFMDQ